MMPFLSHHNNSWLLIIDNTDNRSLDLEGLFASSEVESWPVSTRVMVN